MKEIRQTYRVECNFGSKYFKDLEKALKYFQKKADNRLYVELWQVTYTSTCYKRKPYVRAVQKLIHCSAPIGLDT